MKILYIDPVSHKEHLNYNTMLLKALLEKQTIVDCIFKKDYSSSLDLSERLNIVYEIPKSLYPNKGGIINRLFYLLALYLIRCKVNLKEYDIIIFSYYEEISLYLAYYPSNLYLVNHINISGLNSFIKRFFFLRLSKTNIQIVFENTTAAYLKKIGVKRVRIVPHGLISKYKVNDCSLFLKENGLGAYSYIIFSPSSSSIDLKFLELLVKDPEFNKLLIDYNILLIIKAKIANVISSNIKIIDTYLSDYDYKHFLVCSNAILICYPNTFKYRVSAVLYESLANDKKVFISDIESFREYSVFLDKNSYFTTVTDLIDNIRNEIENNDKPKDFEYNKAFLDNLVPHYSNIFLNK